MMLKSLKYSHYQNCPNFKKINKVVKPEPKPEPKPTQSPPPPPSPSPEPLPKPAARPKSVARPIKREIQEYEEHIEPIKQHPRTERIKVLKEKYNNLVKNAFNI